MFDLNGCSLALLQLVHLSTDILAALQRLDSVMSSMAYARVSTTRAGHLPLDLC